MAWLSLLLAVLAISWGSILARLCDLPALTIGLGRLLAAALLLLPWGAPALRRSRPSAATVLAALAAGLLLALHFALWIASLAHTTVAASTLLVSTAPVASALLSWLLLGERPGARSAFGIGLALVGTCLIAGSDRLLGGGHLTGDLLALGGAVCAAAYLVAGRALRGRLPFMAYLTLVNSSGALWALLFAAALGAPLLPGSMRNFALLVAMAVGPQLLGHGALNWAVRRLLVYLVQLAVLGEPLLASLWAVWIFGEIPPRSIAPGALLVAAGIALVILGQPAVAAPVPPARKRGL